MRLVGFVAAEDLDTTHWVGALTRDVEGSLCSYKDWYASPSRRRLGRIGALVWRTPKKCRDRRGFAPLGMLYWELRAPGRCMERWVRWPWPGLHPTNVPLPPNLGPQMSHESSL